METTRRSPGHGKLPEAQSDGRLFLSGKVRHRVLPQRRDLFQRSGSRLTVQSNRTAHGERQLSRGRRAGIVKWNLSSIRSEAAFTFRLPSIEALNHYRFPAL